MLRLNRDSVMAMLEAFVYDPLISWKLLNNPGRLDLGGRQIGPETREQQLDRREVR
jgi:phosphatidylinositol kinase/protein kinase (PI-3  family)